MALSEAIKEGLYLRQFIGEIEFEYLIDETSVTTW